MADVHSGAIDVSQGSKTQLEIKGYWYYINGKIFFVNAPGHEIGARPGQHPYRKRDSESEREKRNMVVIKAGWS